MLYHWSLLLVSALVTADPITDLQDQWKQYRTLVSDSGFLYNESFVVINDYDESADSTDSTPNNHSDIPDMPKLGFEKTLMGMVSALQDIQKKGDQMMSAITDQKQVLVNLRSEVDKAEERLEEAVQITAAMEEKRNNAENEIKTAERNTRMLSQKKSKIESEIENLQEEKESAQNRLESLQGELREVTEEMENLSNLRQASLLSQGRLSCSDYRSTLTPLQKNLESRQNELSNLERSLQAKTSELSKVKQQIATSTKILDEIKVSLASSPDSASDKHSEQTPSPYLVPALAVSLLLNVVTGGAIITNLVSPTDRSDSEPFQELQSQLVNMDGEGGIHSIQIYKN